MSGSSSPEGLPVLVAGAHLGPEDGVCLMEYVSVLAGERFSDHPACTDPGLAFLAQLINDAVSDAGRHRLTPFAAELTVLGPLDAAGSARLVLAAVARARTAPGAGRKLGRAERRADHRLHRVTRPDVIGRLARTLNPLYVRGSARHGLAAAVSAVAESPWNGDMPRDQALLELLAAAVAAVERRGPVDAADGVPQVTWSARPDVDGADESSSIQQPKERRLKQ